MGKVTRKRYSMEFKAKVAFAVIKGDQNLTELAAKYAIHHTMIAQWKRQAIEVMAATFSGKAWEPDASASGTDVERLHAKIGQPVVERDICGTPVFAWT